MVDLFIEGGGDSGFQHTEFRKGWVSFLSKVKRLEHRMPAIKIGRGRESAFKLFSNAIKLRIDFQNNALLVDSEDPITFAYSGNCITDNQNVLSHLLKRDKWEQPDGYVSNHVFLMVTSMENWLLADVDALSRFYGNGFHLPKPPVNPEKLSRQQAIEMLENATKECTNTYGKNVKNFRLLEHLDPEIVASKCPSFKHFVDCIPI
jgi:hypothetical protein